MRVAAPRDGARLREELGEALESMTVRPPCGSRKVLWARIFRRSSGVPGVDVLARPTDGLGDDVLLIAVGSFASMALAVAERLRNQGIGVTVVDPRWVHPGSRGAQRAGQGPQAGGDPGGQRRSRRYRVVGVGRAAAAEIDVPCRDVGVPQEFLDHASRSEVLEPRSA